MSSFLVFGVIGDDNRCLTKIGELLYFSRLFPDRSLKESTVRTWKKKFLQEISRRKRAGEAVTVEALENKKTGRPLMLGQDLDKQVQSHLAAPLESGAVVNTAIVIACAMDIVKSHNSNLLQCNGGHIVLSKPWVKSLMERMGLVKRRASTKAKVSLPEFDRLKAQFLFDVKAVMELS